MFIHQYFHAFTNSFTHIDPQFCFVFYSDDLQHSHSFQFLLVFPSHPPPFNGFGSVNKKWVLRPPFSAQIKHNSYLESDIVAV